MTPAAPLFVLVLAAGLSAPEAAREAGLDPSRVILAHRDRDLLSAEWRERLAAPGEELRLEVVKDHYSLLLYRGDELIKSYPITIGANPDGDDKKAVGDHRTPEGEFHVERVHDSTHWERPAGRRSYGPWFLRLATPPWSGIGIHGTDEPEVIGAKGSQGCIRLFNSDLRELKALVGVGTQVVVRRAANDRDRSLLSPSSTPPPEAPAPPARSSTRGITPALPGADR
ncbi:MAG: L,D-transpeptidase [Planctomycetes bacterium]|nr:L,D-transpeptidase [Planctomycetota bacterium]